MKIRTVRQLASKHNKKMHKDFYVHKTIDKETFDSIKNRLERFYTNIAKYQSYKNKNNKQEKTSNGFDSLCRKIGYLYNDNKTFVSLDVEAFEHSQEHITEIGLTIFNNSKLEYFHYIIKENYNKRNGKFVSDNKDNFDFGQSVLLDFNDAIDVIKQKLHKCDVLIAHNIKSDKDFLKKHMNLNFKFDFCTARMSRNLHDKGQAMSLKNFSNHLGIKTKHLHNAGNDAAYTAKCMLEVLKLKNILK